VALDDEWMGEWIGRVRRSEMVGDCFKSCLFWKKGVPGIISWHSQLSAYLVHSDFEFIAPITSIEYCELRGDSDTLLKTEYFVYLKEAQHQHNHQSN
jgi:hypothetical protein